jgi:hypothetical protein
MMKPLSREQDMRDSVYKRFRDIYTRSGINELRLLAKGPTRCNFTSRTCRETAIGLCLLAVCLIAAAGCKVQVDKSHDGGGDNVKIATPFGGIAVSKDQNAPTGLGLPVYPGSLLRTDGDEGGSAKVDMGFGSFKLRVRAAQYTAPDSQGQVVAFYRKALSEYGGVIECMGERPVGTPVATAEGLTCDDVGHDHHSSQSHNSGELELKAGSQRHQHLVVIQSGSGPATRFSLIALDLPHNPDSDEDKGTN